MVASSSCFFVHSGAPGLHPGQWGQEAPPPLTAFWGLYTAQLCVVRLLPQDLVGSFDKGPPTAA